MKLNSELNNNYSEVLNEGIKQDVKELCPWKYHDQKTNETKYIPV